MSRAADSVATDREIKEHPLLLSTRWVRALLDGRKTQTRRLIVNDRASTVDVQAAEWWEPYANARGHTGCWSAYRRTNLSDKSRDAYNRIAIDTIRCPFGQIGDRLWVKETFAIDVDENDQRPPAVRYRADGEAPPFIDEEGKSRRRPWKSSRFMPRGASRIDLRVTEIRVQRIKEITEADVQAEGIRTQVGDGGGPGPGWKWNGIGYEGVDPYLYHTPRGGEDHPELCRCIPLSPDGVCYSTVIEPWRCAWREAWDSLNLSRGAAWDTNPWVWAITFEREK